MFGMTIQAAKSGFFDRALVQRSVDRASRKVLSRFGAFVRQRAKSSIRRRRGTSQPGRPPHSHAGLLRRFIFFSYDSGRRSVVIGPTLLRASSAAPRLLEHGGSIRRKRRQLRYRPRPFMGPAFEREKSQLPKLWRDSVK